MALKDLLIAARENAGLNQSEFARMLGVKPQTVQHWEKGKNDPSKKRWPKILEILKVPSTYFDEGAGVPVGYLSEPSDAELNRAQAPGGTFDRFESAYPDAIREFIFKFYILYNMDLQYGVDQAFYRRKNELSDEAEHYLNERLGKGVFAAIDRGVSEFENDCKILSSKDEASLAVLKKLESRIRHLGETEKAPQEVTTFSVGDGIRFNIESDRKLSANEVDFYKKLAAHAKTRQEKDSQ